MIQSVSNKLYDTLPSQKFESLCSVSWLQVKQLFPKNNEEHSHLIIHLLPNTAVLFEKCT